MSVALPRPILKHSSQSHPDLSTDSPLSLHLPRQCRNTVHFPPSPTLTRTFSAHSPSAYDRSPIVVLPNTCALPARGCPGRTYIPGCTIPSPLSPSGSPGSNFRGKHMHPRRALGFGLVQEATPDDLTVASEIPPPLIPDVSSESDESDGFTSPPSGSGANPTVPVPNPLAFLPFASLPNLNIGESAFKTPESPKEEEDHQYHRYEEGKRRRRRRDRGKGGREQCPRQRAYGPNMSIRDLEAKPTNGISGEELEEDDEGEDADIAECRYKSLCSGTSFGGYGLEADDESCLGGF
jgi:hypothetical protein